jgi:hypothetical protein
MAGGLLFSLQQSSSSLSIYRGIHVIPSAGSFPRSSRYFPSGVTLISLNEITALSSCFCSPM